MDELLGGVFPLLQDPQLTVVDAFGMRQPFSEPMAAMGYAIIDGQGSLRHRAYDPSFGHHAEQIIERLQSMPRIDSIDG